MSLASSACFVALSKGFCFRTLYAVVLLVLVKSIYLPRVLLS
uniref:Uncharacterized protein n=1 Tax=Rhizophora mucronata TaxID=61149 RepID=A0A2P2QWA3_RHIMU